MGEDERRQTEAAMAKISRMKREVEVDPAAAVRTSLDASMAAFKSRVLRIMCWMMLLAAVAIAIYLCSRN
jgi:hypothetical protein